MAKREAAPQVQIFATDLDDQAVTAARPWPLPQTDLGRVARAPRALVRRGRRRLLRGRRDPRDVRLLGTRSRQGPAVLETRPDIVPQPVDLSRRLRCKTGWCEPSTMRCGRAGICSSEPSEGVARQSELFAVLDKKHRLFQRRDDVRASLPSGLLGPRAGASELRRPATGPDRRRRCRPACPQCPREVFPGLCGDRPAASGSPLLRADRLLHRASARRGEPRPVQYSPTRSAADGAGCRAEGLRLAANRWSTRISSLRSTTTARSSI